MLSLFPGIKLVYRDYWHPCFDEFFSPFSFFSPPPFLGRAGTALYRKGWDAAKGRRGDWNLGCSGKDSALMVHVAPALLPCVHLIALTGWAKTVISLYISFSTQMSISAVDLSWMFPDLDGLARAQEEHFSSFVPYQVELVSYLYCSERKVI